MMQRDLGSAEDTVFADSLTSTGSRIPAAATDPEHRIRPVLLKLRASFCLRTHVRKAGCLPSAGVPCRIFALAAQYRV